MDGRIAAILAITATALAGCVGQEPKPGRWQSTTNEATVSTGGGNTGAAGTAAAGPSMNSESRKEAAREGR